MRLRLKLKKIHGVLEFNQSHWLKPYIELNTQNITEAEKINDKDRKTLNKLMNNAIYEKKKKKKNLRNSINLKLVNDEKNY